MALTYDGSGKAAGCGSIVNGKPLDAEVVRDALCGLDRDRCAAHASGSKALGPPFVGQIDDLRLYGRALTPAEIDQLALHYRGARDRVRRRSASGRRTRRHACATTS